MLKRYKEYKEKKEAERKARSDAFWERMEREHPDVIAKADREFRRMVKQTEQEVKQMNRERWIQED